MQIPSLNPVGHQSTNWIWSQNQEERREKKEISVSEGLVRRTKRQVEGKKTNGSLGLDGRDGSVAILGDDVSSVKQAASHVLSLLGVAFDLEE